MSREGSATRDNLALTEDRVEKSMSATRRTSFHLRKGCSFRARNGTEGYWVNGPWIGSPRRKVMCIWGYRAYSLVDTHQ